MKILDFPQRSPEWHAARRNIFTASEVGEFVAEEKKFRLTIADARKLLGDAAPPSKATAAEHEAAIRSHFATSPEFDQLGWWDVTEATKKARQNLIAKKLAEPFYTDPALAELAGSAWLAQMREKEEKALDYNAAVQRGIALEDLARETYEKRTGHAVIGVGLCLHESGGFGCSPDGLVYSRDYFPTEGNPQVYGHGIEIKCPIPETHAKYLLAGTLPDEYRPQVHCSLAVTGLDRWDFMSFCPGLPSLLVTVERDAYTERMLAGLLSMSAELEATRAKLAAMWAAEFNR
jgi:hypothetical protein